MEGNPEYLHFFTGVGIALIEQLLIYKFGHTLSKTEDLSWSEKMVQFLYGSCALTDAQEFFAMSHERYDLVSSQHPYFKIFAYDADNLIHSSMEITTDNYQLEAFKARAEMDGKLLTATASAAGKCLAALMMVPYEGWAKYATMGFVVTSVCATNILNMRKAAFINKQIHQNLDNVLSME